MEKYSQLGRSHLHSSGMQQLEMLKDGLKVSSIVDCKGDRGRGGRGDQTNIPLKANRMAFNHSINGGLPLAPQHNVINDLIPYPASAISTVIEKVTGTESLYGAEGARMVVSNSSNNSATLASPGKQSPPASEPEKAKRRPKLESSSSSAHLKKEDISIECTIINHHHHHNHQQQSSSPSSTSSEQSEKVGVLEGTTTTSQQTISANDEKVVVVCNNNTSSAAAASFDSDDIGRIVKLLQAKRENSTQTEEQVVQQCNQYVQVSLDGLATREEDDVNGSGNGSTKRASSSSSSTVAELTRSNQTLRATVDQLSYIVEQMSRERSTTTLQMHALSKTVSAREARIAELAAEREKVQADGDELRFALKNFESLVADYQGSLQVRAGELEAAQKELAAANVEKTQLLSRLEQTRAELQAREALLAELYRVNGLNQEEMAAARQYCASLADQLEAATKTAKDHHQHHQLQEQQRQRRMTQRLQGCRASAAELRTEVQSLRTSTMEELQCVMAEWTARKEDLVRKMEVASLFCQSSPSSNCERLSSPKPLSRLHTSIEDIRQELTSLQESLTAHTLPSH